MWLVWTCVAIIFYALCEVYEKKSVDFEEPFSEGKLLVWFGIFALLVSVLISVAGLRESDVDIIHRIVESPVFVLSPVFYFLSLFIAFVSLKLIPVSVEVQITNTDGIMSFIGAVSLYAFLGKYDVITEKVTPVKVILVLLTTVTALVFSAMHQKNVRTGEDAELAEKIKKRGKKGIFGNAKVLTAIGIICAFLSAAFDAGDSVIEYYIIGEVADSYEYLFFAGIVTWILSLVVWIYISIRLKKAYNPFSKGQLNKALGAFLDCTGTVATVLAVAENPFWTNPLVSTYGVFTVLFSRIILKEKLSLKQYVCIGILVCEICAFAFLDV